MNNSLSEQAREVSEQFGFNPWAFTSQLLSFAIVIAIVCVVYRLLARSAWGWLQLPPTKFWQLVGRVQQPIVLLTLRGFFRRRPCYLYPYHGIVFYTWSRPDDLPAGVSIISTADAPV